MHKTPELPELLALLDERSAAFRAVIRSAPDLDAKVPTCPEWTLLDLARHLGGGQRRWAAIAAAGPTDEDPAEALSQIGATAPREPEALLTWLSESTRQLLDATREAGPDRGCWVWWGDTQSPRTCGAAARHQVYEVAVHTYDAQITAGAAQELPDEVAVDGIEEFLSTCGTTTVAWPYEAATVDVRVIDGPTWRVTLSADGASMSQLPKSDAASATGDLAGPGSATAFVKGTANDLMLAFYDRIPMTSVELGGDVHVIDLLRAWDMEP